ncbi:hypothetical protein [Tenacibaculum sp. 47A_GOM-205m]|uniref:hypothetical protein n=1 Tax=Tenacibaculum sp. 47A_GOM-205m TaxID=1380384 RepID=UPI00048E0550|nr:hypothetical protein [Tenacibaculum sp. 47A_GOM-205m]
MKKIAGILMDYGMDFEYENHGSNGEKIQCCELGIEVSNQNGKIYYQLSAPTETIEESEDAYSMLANMVEQECISETSSF